MGVPIRRHRERTELIFANLVPLLSFFGAFSNLSLLFVTVAKKITKQPEFADDLPIMYLSFLFFQSYSFKGLKIFGYLRKKLQENGFFDEAFGHRRKRSSVGKIGFHHRQVSPPGTEGRCRQMRR